MSNTNPADGGAMPKSLGELTENIVGRLAAHRHPYSLQASILRYRGEIALHSAMCMEAAERGEDDNLPFTWEHSMEVLENWDRPAGDIVEAMMALELAAEDYDMGDTDRIPAMIKAALGWITAEQKRRTAA